ncbi:hypothetical protein FE257_001359 [Aspergillus nanangensis]|uniref:Berberine/berberine-like domain-containing protein n=1 Tax=Aspergillus nanangensis TaxID=2582783 RepID=A0AAD4GPP5_ASPNN|nr:hypothetical protein FE257_001359 [Aspergillus nanangensis]
MATSMLSHTQAEASMRPILDFAKDVGVTSNQSLSSFPRFKEFMQDLVKRTTSSVDRVVQNIAMSSCIVPLGNFQGMANKTTLTEALNNIALAGGDPSVPPIFLVCITAPSLYTRRLPETDQKGGPGYSSVTPAWRDGLWHVIYVQSWPEELDPSAVENIWEETSETMNILRHLTPGGGAYQNEAGAFEPDPVGAFWGMDNYARLSRIKKDLDPENVLTVHQGVGWKKQDPRYTCYPKVSA